MPETNANIEFERIKSLFRMGIYGLYSNILMATICVLMLWNVSDHRRLLEWWGPVVSLDILRIYLVSQSLKGFLQKYFNFSRMKLFENYYFLGVVVSSVLWILVLTLPIKEEVNMYVLGLIFITGLSVILTTGTLSLSPKSSIAFITLITAGVMYKIYDIHFLLWNVLDTAIFFIMFTAIVFSRQLFKLQIGAMKFKPVQENLVRELFKTNFNYATLNTRLERQINRERVIRNGLLEAFQFQLGIIKNSLSATFILDKFANFIQTNRIGGEILGYTPDELFGMQAKLFFDKAAYARISIKYEKLLSQGVPIIGHETKIIRKDGSRADILFNATPIYKGGKVIGSVCSCEDVTEKKRIEMIKVIRLEILEMLAQSVSLSRILRKLLKNFKKINHCSGCGVLLKEVLNNKMYFMASVGLSRPYRRWMEDVIKCGSPLPSVEALRQTKAQVIDDVTGVDCWQPCFKSSAAKEILSCISLPVKGDHGHPIAVFEVYSNEPKISTRLNMRLVEEFIELAKIVIERKSIENMLISRNKKLNLLYKTSSVVLEEIDLNRLFEKILLLMKELREYQVKQRVKIFTGEDDKLHLFYDSHYAPGDTKNPCFVVKEGECLCGLCLKSGEVIVCESSNLDMRHEKIEALMEEHGHIVIPLRGRDKVSGVLCLYTSPMKRDLEDAEKFFFLSIGRQIGLALENASLYKELKRLSLNDPLTGLANRYRMNIMVQKLLPLAKRTGKPLTVAMIDIDHFKKYNDTYGHPEGDKLLISLAGILNQSVREEDLAVRFGGEEFLMIFSNTDLEEAQVIVERIRLQVLNHTKTSISVGLALYNNHCTFDELVNLADIALYEAKNSGRNRIVVSK